MRKNFGVKTWLYPMPVLIVAAYDASGVPNAMNAAWGGIHTDDMVGLCLSEGHKTTKNILEKKAFTVSVGTLGRLAECDYVGIASGNKVADKFAKAGFTVRRSEFVDAPIIEEYPLTLECRVKQWDPSTGYLIGEIVASQADESILTDGKVDLGKLRPIIFDPSFNAYRVVGEVVGRAFSDGLKLKN